MKCGTRIQIHQGMDIGKNNIINPSSHKGHLGGVRGSQIQKCGRDAKKLYRSGPNLAQVCKFIWEWACPDSCNLFLFWSCKCPIRRKDQTHSIGVKLIHFREDYVTNALASLTGQVGGHLEGD